MRKKVGIIGAGPAGVFCAITALKNNKNIEITLFDTKNILYTLLPTGNGRCNLAYCEYDFKELTKFYPRGSKFLYSIFSQFSTNDTLEFFNKIGVETYIQDDFRIFPKANSSKFVREKMLDSLLNKKNCKFKKEKVIYIEKKEKFIIKTSFSEYKFDKVVIATGGNEASYKLIKDLGHGLTKVKPSLCALRIEENYLFQIPGVVLKNVSVKVENEKNSVTGDILITHKNISGPLIYKISSLNAYKEYPYNIYLDFINSNFSEFDFQNILNKYSKKNILNILSCYIPKSFADVLLTVYKINKNLCGYQINKETRGILYNLLTNFRLTIIGSEKDGETVKAGGVDLSEINPKTLSSRIVENLYFCGEVLDIDGFCGGFNLQNCWSTGYIVGKNL